MDRSRVSSMHVGDRDQVAPGVSVAHTLHCQDADVAMLQVGMAQQLCPEIELL